ncbi:MAG: hypothetical protein ACYTFA_08230 [Planctomycetota bacterium]|jgi:hypothetical protein
MSKLKLRSLHRCSIPAYPTKLEALADGKLLENHLPPGWLSHGDLAGVLGTFLAANTVGCSPNTPPATGNTPATNTNPAKAAIVAPLFEHGDGRGATGCVVVAVPVFLSEEEALLIVLEELAGHGLDLSEKNVELSSVVIRRTVYERQYDWVSERHGHVQREVVEPFNVDLRDPEKGIAVEYVARDECRQLGGQVFGASSVSSYDLKSAARSVADQVSSTGRGAYFGAFYDPLVYADRSGYRYAAGAENRRARMRDARTQAAAESKRLLRQQVRDFVDWLKGQGVI